MQKVTDLQTLQLKGLNQGHLMTIVITQATQAPILEFRNAEDTAWSVHPDFDGTPASGVCVQSVRCLSAQMRITHGAAPTGDYYLSVLWEAVPTF